MGKTLIKCKHSQGDTKQFVVDTARDLFSEQGYLGVSMRDIAKKLNITKAALYYHFIGKEEIYKEVLQEVFNDLESVIQRALAEDTIDNKMHKLVEKYLYFGLREKNLIRAMMVKFPPDSSAINALIVDLRGKIFCQIEPTIKEFCVHNKIMKNSNPHLLTELLLGMMDGLLLEYSLLGSKINPKIMAGQITAILSLR